MLIIIGVILAVAAVGGWFIYYFYRRLLREAKNYERGLKMVTLLIHLPPSSDDIEVGGRDARDVAEETISKAQVLYNVLASTAQSEKFKVKYYGQRHLGLEIAAKKGTVRFYAAVPVSMLSVVEQAVVSAYPNAQVEEVPEYNIFSSVGRISGTIGGEMELKEHFSHPIATFQETKRDAIQSILNAFSNMSNEDGAAVQILIRPARQDWTKEALKIASDKRDNKKKKGGASMAGSFAKELATAAWKAPEPKDDNKKPDDKKLSSLDQANIDSIEDKTRHPGFESLIRVIASSNTAARSQAILGNLVAAFALFDAPSKNGFKFVPAKDIENFVSAFIFRFFPQEHKNTILNSVELATLFHLPDQQSTTSSSIERQASKQVDGPSKMPEQGLLLGYNVYRGAKKEIRLSEEDRRRHLYMVGQTGTGKSVLLENLALQDMIDGRGFAFIDPHGDTVESLMSMVPKERVEDVVYFSPADMDYPLGLNLFEFKTDDQKDFLIQEAINMLYKLYDPQRTGIIGPRYEHLFRNAALTVMSGPDGGTFIDIPKLFSDRSYVNKKLQHVTDQTVRDFWLKEMPGSERSNEFGEVKSWFVSKFGAFLSNEMMRNIIGQTKSSFDLRQIMDENKILFVNLSKGRTGELNSKLLGMIFVMKFQAAAMSRANIPEDQRRDFSLYVDEFQNFSTDSFATILSEARKYRLNLIVANQFIGQLDENVRDAVFGNVGSVISLRTGANDADFLTKQFSPIFDTEDLVKLPNFNAVVRLMINGVPSQPFSMATIPPLGHPNQNLSLALKRLSAAKYGTPRKLVEERIFERLKSQPEPSKFPSSPFGADQSFGGLGAQFTRPQPPKLSDTPSSGSIASTVPPINNSAQPGSFLDQWLAKQRQIKASIPPAQSMPKPAGDLDAVNEAPQPTNQPTPKAGEDIKIKDPRTFEPSIPKAVVPPKPEPKEVKPQTSSRIDLRPQQTEAPLVGQPSDFAKAKASGSLPTTEELRRAEQAKLSGSMSDKKEAADLASLVKQQIDDQPLQNSEPSGVATENQTGPAQIIIDEEGRLTFQGDKTSE